MSDFEARHAAQNHMRAASEIADGVSWWWARWATQMASSVVAALLYVGDAITEHTRALAERSDDG